LAGQRGLLNGAITELMTGGNFKSSTADLSEFKSLNKLYVCVFLYADDILLIAPSVCGLDALVKTCEFELDKLDMVVSTRKSCC